MECYFASAIVFPDRQIWLIPFPVQIPMKIYVAGAIAIEFFSTLGTGGDNVSHVTHLAARCGLSLSRRGIFCTGCELIISIGNAAAPDEV